MPLVPVELALQQQSQHPQLVKKVLLQKIKLLMTKRLVNNNHN
jgi:hypothetical protein